MEWPALPGALTVCCAISGAGSFCITVAALLWSWVAGQRGGAAHPAVATGIGERQQAEAALRESEARFRDVTEAASDWIWEMDENLRFTYLSERFFALTGIAPQHVLGRARWELATAISPSTGKNGVNTGKPWKSVCLFAILSTAPVSATTSRRRAVSESQWQADL
jgi:PAS domain-containing protein